MGLCSFELIHLFHRVPFASEGLGVMTNNEPEFLCGHIHIDNAFKLVRMLLSHVGIIHFNAWHIVLCIIEHIMPFYLLYSDSLFQTLSGPGPHHIALWFITWHQLCFLDSFTCFMYRYMYLFSCDLWVCEYFIAIMAIYCRPDCFLVVCPHLSYRIQSHIKST